MCAISPSNSNFISNESTTTLISEAEAALYDRQIRLWGLEAQGKLKRARLLLHGMTPMGAEVAKNLVLAGVASLDIYDDQVVTPLDTAFNFLIPESAKGENRAKASVTRTQALNPMVCVTAQDAEFSSVLNELRTHDVIILTSVSIEDISSKWLAIDRALEKWIDDSKKPQIICIYSLAKFGLAFCNFHHHEFIAEDILPKKRKQTDGTELPAQLSSNTETVLTKKVITYPSLSQSLKLKWDLDEGPISSNRIPKGFFLMQLLQQSISKDNNLTVELLQDKWKQLSQELGVASSLLTEEDFECCSGSDTPAVNAVLGGVVAQEIVRAITCKGAPQGNWYFLNALQCSVTVEWLPEMRELAYA